MYSSKNALRLRGRNPPKNPIIGKTIQIKTGHLKNHFGIVKATEQSSLFIELHKCCPVVKIEVKDCEIYEINYDDKATSDDELESLKSKLVI